MRRISLLAASASVVYVAVLLPLASCENATGPRLGAYALTSVSGDAQKGVVGDPLGAPLRVRLLAGERPMANLKVTWSSSDSGLLDGDVSRTDKDGYASMGWTMGRTPGTYHARAAVGSVGSVDFTATATAGSFAKLRLNPDTLVLADVADTASFRAFTMDRFGNDVEQPPITWSSLDPQVAAVSATGQIRGLNGGTARIVASCLGMFDTARVVVRQRPAAVALVTKNVLIRSLRATLTLRANVLDRLGNPIPGATTTWTSLDPLGVAVDGNGVTTAVSVGTARVRVATGTFADTAQVTVVQVPKQIAMLPATATLPAGGSMLIQPTAYDSLGSVVPSPSLTWLVRAPDLGILRLQEEPGWVLGVAPGSAYVYVNAWYEGQISASGSTLITVGAGPITRVTVTPAAATLRVGDTRALVAVATDSLGNVAAGAAVTWNSSDATVATVSATGLVTGVRLGTATISATVGGVTGTAQINVASLLPASVRVSRDVDTLNYLGATRTVTAEVFDGFGNVISGLTPTWSTLDAGAMSMTSAGLATELVGGGVIGRAVATYGGLADTALIVLRQVPRSISVTPTNLSLAPGDSSAVTLSVGTDSSGAVISSTAANESNPAVARVRWTGGVPYVIGVAAGTATVSFYAGGASLPEATVNVTVTAPPSALVPVEPPPGLVIPAGARRAAPEGS